MYSDREEILVLLHLHQETIETENVIESLCVLKDSTFPLSTQTPTQVTLHDLAGAFREQYLM